MTKQSPEDEVEEIPQDAEPLSDDEAATEAAGTLQGLAKKAEENLEGWKRAQADYQNLQKETQQRMQEVSKFATQQFVLELLPMVDHFQYALAGIPDEDKDNAWAKGIEYIQKNFLTILQSHGVEMIDALGKPFDPHMHEAVEEVEVEGKESGTVAEVLANGFTMGDKVIQVAKVKVVK